MLHEISLSLSYESGSSAFLIAGTLSSHFCRSRSILTISTMKQNLLLLIVVCFFAPLFAKGYTSPPSTVSVLDFEKYTGRWFQLADFPQLYELVSCKACVIADYSLNDDGSINIVNDAKSTSSGIPCRTRGRAVVKDTLEPGKLSVRFNFFPSFFPDKEYWIVEVGPLTDEGLYSWAIVSKSSRGSLYFLSRTPSVSRELFNELLLKAKNHGFDLSKLVITEQSNCSYPEAQ